MRISFDFDDCLDDNKIVQFMCKNFLSGGHEVFVISNRDPLINNEDLIRWCKNFGIDEKNIILAGSDRKVHHFIQNRIDIHFDNSFEDVSEINNFFKDTESQPAILVNFNSSEIADIYNYSYVP